ncbi:MAG: hypothetical protein ACYC2T_03395 [Bacillota bacterium]
MRTPEEIMDQITYYQQELAQVLLQREGLSAQDNPGDSLYEMDLTIFSLIDRLEALLWVMEIAPPDGDMFYKPNGSSQ